MGVRTAEGFGYTAPKSLSSLHVLERLQLIAPSSSVVVLWLQPYFCTMVV